MRRLFWVLFYAFSASKIDHPNYVRPKACTNDVSSCGGTLTPESCGWPKRYYATWNAQDSCCPKYNCICKGLDDPINKQVVLEYKAEMEKYYANCTIIEKNVLFDVSDQIDVDMTATFEHIEEVYGNIQIEGDGITQVSFLNLRIIRGEELSTRSELRGQF